MVPPKRLRLASPKTQKRKCVRVLCFAPILNSPDRTSEMEKKRIAKSLKTGPPPSYFHPQSLQGACASSEGVVAIQKTIKKKKGCSYLHVIYNDAGSFEPRLRTANNRKASERIIFSIPPLYKLVSSEHSQPKRLAIVTFV